MKTTLEGRKRGGNLQNNPEKELVEAYRMEDEGVFWMGTSSAERTPR